MPKPANPKVKKYLRNIGVAEDDVPDTVMDALNGLQQNELDAMEKVGASVKNAADAGGDLATLAKVH
jgi:hypothetical protein